MSFVTLAVVALLGWLQHKQLQQTERRIINKMSEISESLATANQKLDQIDERTTAEAAEVKAVVDQQREIIERLEAGQVTPEDVEALKALNSRLEQTAENVRNIYSSDSEEVGQPAESTSTASTPDSPAAGNTEAATGETTGTTGDASTTGTPENPSDGFNS